MCSYVTVCPSHPPPLSLGRVCVWELWNLGLRWFGLADPWTLVNARSDRRIFPSLCNHGQALTLIDPGSLIGLPAPAFLVLNPLGRSWRSQMLKRIFSWLSLTHWTEHTSWPGPLSTPIKVPGHHRPVRPDFTLREDSLATSGADVIRWLQGELSYNQQPCHEEGPPRQKPSSTEYSGEVCRTTRNKSGKKHPSTHTQGASRLGLCGISAIFNWAGPFFPVACHGPDLAASLNRCVSSVEVLSLSMPQVSSLKWG